MAEYGKNLDSVGPVTIDGPMDEILKSTNGLNLIIRGNFGYLSGFVVNTDKDCGCLPVILHLTLQLLPDGKILGVWDTS
ncbi:unnamed protein product [marine sediment metagenome]|uniref:Uncharacterized protein n=1 Tax=marine sediment metagenome TaxID=412755 RepID=X1JHB7_9ZZZZ